MTGKGTHIRRVLAGEYKPARYKIYGGQRNNSQSPPRGLTGRAYTNAEWNAIQEKNRRTAAITAIQEARRQETRVNNALNNAAKNLSAAMKKQRAVNNALAKAAGTSVNNVNNAFKRHRKTLRGRVQSLLQRL